MPKANRAAIAKNLKEASENMKKLVDALNALNPANFGAPMHVFRGYAGEDGDRFVEQFKMSKCQWETDHTAQVSTVAEVNSIQQPQRRPSGQPNWSGNRYSHSSSRDNHGQNPDIFNGWCYYCNKYGHREIDCRKKTREMGRPSHWQPRQQQQKKRQYNGGQQQQQQACVHVIEQVPKVVKTEHAQSVADSRSIILTYDHGNQFEVAATSKNS
eukprot:GDKI01048606.1.p1 GENE.GDKI01048606.1~~GDKI01048606.1.p1  ORF type:complete len:213 (+),score=56.78 GDKI01048606.1:179-817(+)